MKPLLHVTADEVIIDHGPFTDVAISHSSFARWSPARIAAHHQAVRRWRRWGWLGRLGLVGRWIAARANVPIAKPPDRSLTVQCSMFVLGDPGIAVAE